MELVDDLLNLIMEFSDFVTSLKMSMTCKRLYKLFVSQTAIFPPAIEAIIPPESAVRFTALKSLNLYYNTNVWDLSQLTCTNLTKLNARYYNNLNLLKAPNLTSLDVIDLYEKKATVLFPKLVSLTCYQFFPNPNGCRLSLESLMIREALRPYWVDDYTSYTGLKRLSFSCHSPEIPQLNCLTNLEELDVLKYPMNISHFPKLVKFSDSYGNCDLAYQLTSLSTSRLDSTLLYMYTNLVELEIITPPNNLDIATGLTSLSLLSNSELVDNANMSKLVNLRNLKLGNHANLTGEVLLSLTNLTCLYMGSNDFGPHLHCLIKLRELHIQFTDTIVDNLKELTNLTYLDWPHFPPESEFEELPWITNLQTLVVPRVSHEFRKRYQFQCIICETNVRSYIPLGR